MAQNNSSSTNKSTKISTLPKLKKNIIFLGGIPGTGKSTLGPKACHKLNIEYTSASQILRFDKTKKNTDNIMGNQKILIQRLNKIRKEKIHLLDGHFCLANIKKNIRKIPLEIFEHINPLALIILVRTEKLIQESLKNRDGRDYDIGFLQNMQKKEVAHARNVGKKLKIKCFKYKSEEFLKNLNEIRKLIADLKDDS